MNKGKINTIILLSLFILSIVLISKTFTNNDNISISLGENKKDSSKDLIISEIVYPKKILVNYTESTHTIVNSNKYDLWDESKDIVKSVFTNENMNIEEISGKELIEEKNKSSIDIIFSDELPIRLINRILNISLPNANIERLKAIKSIYIRVGSEDYIIVSNESNSFKINNVEYGSDKISDIMEIIKSSNNFINYWPGRINLGTEEDVYIPYNMPNNKEDVIVENDIRLNGSIEENEYIDGIAEGFFHKDSSYFRKIVDNSGVIIYMYNENTGLLVHPNGLLEYSSTLEDVNMERDINESLDTAIDFIITRDRRPEGLYLSKIKEITAKNNSKGYKFVFDYKINDRIVYINNNGDNLAKPLVVEVFNDSVKSYKRFYRDIVISEERDIYGDKRINPEDIIEMNIEKIAKEFIDEETVIASNAQEKIYEDILSSIKNISLGYYDKASEYYKTPLVDVWVIDIGDSRFIFNTRSGNMITVESIS